MLLLVSQQLGLSIHRPGCRSTRPLTLRWQQPPPRMAAPLPIEQIITDSLDRHAQRLQKLLPSEEPRLVRLQEATADDWRLVIDALAPFLKEKKLRSYQDVLGRRRVALQILIENVADPHNAQAALRTVGCSPIRACTGCDPMHPRTPPVAAADSGGTGRAARAHRRVRLYVPAARCGGAHCRRTRGCSPVTSRLQPCVFEAAAMCNRGCYRL